MIERYDYSMFNDFIDTYLTGGFQNISREDPLVIEMEAQLANRNQFFYVADLLKLQLLFVSNGSKNLIGVDPDEFNLYTFYSRTHPDEQARYNIARSKLIQMGPNQINKKEFSIYSTHFSIMNATGNYFNLLFQGCLFSSEIPIKSVYVILVFTDISKFSLRKTSYHYYTGADLTLFRYPDNALLKIGYSFSDREFEILQLIAAGMESLEIADKLFLSVNTINTHRRNMLKKTKKLSTHDIVIELQEKGIL